MQAEPLHVIQHSGQTFKAYRRGPAGLPVWPLEELFARRHFTPSVEARIRKLHPDGLEEGSIIRGAFRKPLSWRRAKVLKQRDALGWRAYRRKGGKSIAYAFSNDRF